MLSEDKEPPYREFDKLFSDRDDLRNIDNFTKIVQDINDIELLAYTILLKWRYSRNDILAEKTREFFIVGFTCLAELASKKNSAKKTSGVFSAP